MTILYHCEKCNCAVTEHYGSGRFCSLKCSRSASTTMSNKPKTKPCNCVVCGKEFQLAKTAKAETATCSKECRKLRPKPKNRFTTFDESVGLGMYRHTCKMCGTSFEHESTFRPRCAREACNRHDGFIENLIKHFGMKANSLGTSQFLQEYERIRVRLTDEYVNQGLSTINLAERYNYPEPRTFSRFLKYFDIPLRSQVEATDNYLRSDRYIPPETSNSMYKSGHHTSFEGKTFWYRSSYELAFAKEMDEAQIAYDIEALRIEYWCSQKEKFRIAVPDFYIPSANLIVEIKSKWTLDVTNMKDRVDVFTKMGYDFMLVLDGEEVALDDLNVQAAGV